MAGIDRIDVHEGDGVVVLEELEARDLARDDLAEDAGAIGRMSHRGVSRAAVRSRRRSNGWAPAGSAASKPSADSRASPRVPKRSRNASRTQPSLWRWRATASRPSRPDARDAPRAPSTSPSMPALLRDDTAKRLERPVAGRRQRQRAGDVGARPLGRGAEVGLGDDDQVRDLDDARLHELQRIARARLDAEHDGVGDARDVGLGLADADRLDQHPVEQRAHHDHRRQRLIGEPAQPVARRHRAHEAALVARVVDDAHPVAQQRAATGLGRRIDGDHADGLAALAPGRDQRGTERGLADARRPGDADDVRARTGATPRRAGVAPCRCRDRAPARRAPMPARACRPLLATGRSASRLIRS